MVRSPATLDRLEAIYTIWMKLADLLDFILLATAVLLVSRDNNLLGVRTYYGDDTDREPRFWLIICIYWLVCLAWDVAGGVYIGDPFAWQMIPFWFFLPLAVISVFSRRTPRHWITNLARPAVVVLAVAYLLMFKAPEMARPKTSLPSTMKTALAAPVDAQGVPGQSDAAAGE